MLPRVFKFYSSQQNRASTLGPYLCWPLGGDTGEDLVVVPTFRISQPCQQEKTSSPQRTGERGRIQSTEAEVLRAWRVRVRFQSGLQ